MHFQTVTAVVLAALTIAQAQPFAQRRYINETGSDDSTEIAPTVSSPTTWAEWTSTSTSSVDGATTSSSTSASDAVTNSTTVDAVPSSSSSLSPSSSSLLNSTWADWSVTPSATEVSPEITSAPGTAGLVANVTSVVESTSLAVSTTVSAKTLTYTQGVDGSSTVITTTIHITQTYTLTNTVYATITAAKSGGAFFGAVTSGASSDEPTTTVVATSTITKTVTVDPVEETGAGETGFNAVGTGAAPTSTLEVDAEGSEATQCAVSVVTVTTVIKSTVTVTPTASSTAVSEAPLEVMPSFGFSNGTDSASRSRIGSSGFLSKPAYATPTGGW